MRQSAKALGLIAILLVAGYIMSGAAGVILHAVGIQGYSWDNLTIQALLFATVLALALIIVALAGK